ncbi:hypothetical protein PFISCL1PPCAC_25671, partial [Pristionchus fissidentatus]
SFHSSHFSRECSICLSENPLLRATLTECGHICCLACAQQFALNGRKFKCPTCQKQTGFVVMVEEKEEKEESIEVKSGDMGEMSEKKRRMDETTEDESNKEKSYFKAKKTRQAKKEIFKDTTDENKEIEENKNN